MWYCSKRGIAIWNVWHLKVLGFAYRSLFRWQAAAGKPHDLSPSKSAKQPTKTLVIYTINEQSRAFSILKGHSYLSYSETEYKVLVFMHLKILLFNLKAQVNNFSDKWKDVASNRFFIYLTLCYFVRWWHDFRHSVLNLKVKQKM